MIKNPDLFAIYVGFAKGTGEEIKGRISFVKNPDGSNSYYIRPLNQDFSLEVDPYSVQLDPTAAHIRILQLQLRSALHDDDMEEYDRISKEIDIIIEMEKKSYGKSII
jgi:hypothetical protein